MKRTLFFIFIITLFITVNSYSQEFSDLFEVNNHPENRLGPLITKVGAIWQLLALTMQAESSSTLKKNSLTIGFQWSISNYFHQLQPNEDKDHPLLIETDVETHLYSFDVNYGILDWWTVGLEFQFVHHFSGFMDPYIQSFHRTVRSPNGGREIYPDNEISIYIYDVNKSAYLFKIQSAKFGLSDTVLKSKMKIFQSDNKAVGFAGILAVKFPTGSGESMLGSGGFDFSIGLAADVAPFKWWIIYINFYYIFVGDFKGPNNYELPLTNKWQLIVSNEWRVSAKSSFYFQFNMFSSPWQELKLERISGMGYEFFIGFKYRISRNFIFQFHFMEDWDPWTTSDISFAFGFIFKI